MSRVRHSSEHVGDVIALAAPLSLTDADLDHIVNMLGAVFSERSSKVVT